MPLNFGRETPAEFKSRLEHDAQALWKLVSSLSGDEPDFESEEERNFALAVADDFIDRGDSSLRPEKYIQQIYELATSGKGV